MELSPDVAARLERARQGGGAKRLRVADLRPGTWGVLDVVVEQIHPERTFQRKNGSQGRVGRVTVTDGSGSIDLVLWDGDIGHPALQPGAHVRIHGPTVKSGWKGGHELGIEGAEVVAVDADSTDITGTVTEIGATDIVDGRFRCDLGLDAADGPVRMVLWDDTIKAARDAGIGARVRLEGVTPHPGLDGWYIADGATLHRD